MYMQGLVSCIQEVFDHASLQTTYPSKPTCNVNNTVYSAAEEVS